MLRRWLLGRVMALGVDELLLSGAALSHWGGKYTSNGTRKLLSTLLHTMNCMQWRFWWFHLGMERKELEMRSMLQRRGVVGQPHTEEHRLVQDLLKTALNAGKGNYLNDNASAFLWDINNAFVCLVQGLLIFRCLAWVGCWGTAKQTIMHRSRHCPMGLELRRWPIPHTCTLQRPCKIFIFAQNQDILSFLKYPMHE